MNALTTKFTLAFVALYVAVAMVGQANGAQASPHFYQAETKQDFETYSRDPKALKFPDHASISRPEWVDPPYKTCLDVEQRPGYPEHGPFDRGSTVEFSRCATLVFLKMWADTPRIPAPDATQVTLAIAYTINLYDLSGMYGTLDAAEQDAIGSIAKAIPPDTWHWGNGSVIVHDEVAGYAIGPIAWFRDKRDGKHKVLVEVDEWALQGTMISSAAFIIEEHENAIEITGSAWGDLIDWDKAGRPALPDKAAPSP